jgi:EmrB/QacA subfamily drug resistance transporter
MHSPSRPAAAAPLDQAAVRSIIVGILLAMFLAALDQTIVATALPTIGRELGDARHVPWIVTAYLLTSTAVTPLYGKLSDIHGRRVTLLTGIGIFVLGSTACALAPSMLVLILARGLQGLGGGGLISLAQTIIADVVSPKERARYQAHIASVFVASSVAGPVLGGFFAEHLHWSMIFWINLPLGLVAFIMTNRVLRRLPRHERPHALDLPGAGLMIMAASMLLLALTWGGVRYPWASPEILGLLGLSLLAWLGFGARLLTASEPFLPLSVMLNRVVAAGTASAFFVMGTLIGLSVFVPIYLELVQGMTASNTGLMLIPLMGGTVTGATISGRLMARLTHYKRVPILGLCLAISAVATLALEPASLSVLTIEVLLGATGIGLGTLLPVATVAIQNAVLPYQVGTATGSMNFFRSLGGAIMVAAFGAILSGGGVAADVERGTSSASALPADAAADPFGWVFMAAAASLAIGLAFLILMEERPLRGRDDKGPPVAAAAD